MDNIQPQNTTKQKDYLLPASIIIAALLVSGTWIYTAGLKNIEPQKLTAQVADKAAPGIENVKAVNETDHIRGDKNAPVKIVEFSDMECPFCKRFHETILRIVNEYGATGQIAWVYRHFPLEQLHPLARKAAEASECAEKIGGNNAFGQYLDEYMASQSSEESLISNNFTKIAGDVGLNKSQFETCLNSGEFSDKIDVHIQDAINSGAQGTPYSIIIGKNNKKYEINGAQPYEQVKLFIEEALK
jgi:protein-disulfide isomerase